MTLIPAVATSGFELKSPFLNFLKARMKWFHDEMSHDELERLTSSARNLACDLSADQIQFVQPKTIILLWEMGWSQRIGAFTSPDGQLRKPLQRSTNLPSSITALMITILLGDHRAGHLRPGIIEGPNTY